MWNRYSGNKNRLSPVMFCLRYVNFISRPFCSLSHKPLLIQYSVNNKRLKNKRNIQLVIFFVCYMYTIMAYLNPALSFQREQKHACRLKQSFCVILLTAENRKFCKIRRSAIVGGICITKKCKKSQIWQWLIGKS